jgi:hypothetical protein
MLQVIDHDHFREVTAKHAQVFDPNVAVFVQMLTVESVLDELLIVDSIQYVVSVLGKIVLLL